MWHVLYYDIFINETESASGLYSFNCRVETDEFLKVTDSHVHRTSGDVSETAQDRDVTDDIRK